MEAFAVFAALAVILISGAGILRLIGRADYPSTPLLERLGLCWLLGSGFISIATFALGYAIRGTALLGILTVSGLLLFWLSLREEMGTRQRGRSLSSLEWVLAIVICVELAFVCWRASQVSLGWDGVVLWEGKARIAALNGGVIPLRFYSEPPFEVAQQRYPLYLPLSESWLYLWLGDADQSWVRVVGPMTYAAVVFVLMGACLRLGLQRQWAMVVSAAYIFVPYCLAGRWNGLVGYADFPLGAFYLAAVSRLPGINGRPSKNLWMFAVLAGLATWVKQEGFYLWLILMVAAVPQLILARQWRAALIVALPGALIGFGYKAFLAAVHAQPDPFYHGLTVENLVRFSDRIWPVFSSLCRELVNLENWSLLWVGALGALILHLTRNGERIRASLWGVVVIGPLLMYVWPFVLSALPSYLTHVEHAMPRLMFQVAPAAMLLIASAIPRADDTRLAASEDAPSPTQE